jgi:hypothetical protein
MIHEGIQGCRNPDAALRPRAAQAGLQAVRVRRVHLKPHGARGVIAPSPDRFLPAEIVNPHSFASVAADAVFIQCSLGAEVEIFNAMVEHPQRRFEVVELTGFTRGNRRGSDEMKIPFGVAPIDHRRLHEGIPVDQQNVLRPVRIDNVRKLFGQEIGVIALLRIRDIEVSVHLGFVDTGQLCAVVVGAAA